VRAQPAVLSRPFYAALLLFGLVGALGACAVTTSPEIAAPSTARNWYDVVDWKKAGDETVEVLRAYLRVDTTNPPGNETLGAQFIGSILEKEQIPYEIVEYAPGRGNLIARLEAEHPTEKPICLLSHIDVVTAEADKWPKDKQPLSGALDEKGFIWGRGALDMKGLGALELMTMVLLKRAHVPLRRHVILLAVAAEESDSGGVQFIVDKHWGKIGCSHSVNEGGLGIHDLLIEGQTVYAISVAEKGVLWLKMTAHGEAGHGSTPVPGRAPERLLRAIDRLMKRDPDPIVHPSMYELAARVGEASGGVKGFVLRRPVLVRKLVMGKLLENPPARATLFNTVNVTGFEGKKEPNVIPSEVSAILDCRVLPTTRPIDLFVELRKVVDDPNVTFEILDAMGAGESTWEDPFFSAMARHAVDGRPNVVAGPALSPGYTDSLYLRKKGVRAYGFVPFELAKEELNGFHGRDERVSVANVHRGIRTLFRAVVDVSVVR
jgi:acetylornithine deacetylase/succinyl-diaminopimelate desuccinylase-like protein